MPAAYTTLQITDGTVTANLVDGVNYQLVDGGWAPSVAPLRTAVLGGSGPYDDVIEEITVNVTGASGAACLANLATLAQLLDQAERWNRGEIVAAVRLCCQPQGSTLTAPLECAILGRAGETAVATPATFNDRLMIYEIPDVRLRFVRRGLWLEQGETVGPSGAVTNPGIASVTFGSAASIASPTRVALAATVASYVPNALLLWAGAVGRIAIAEGEAQSSGSVWTYVSDTSHLARGGYVLRYTPTNTGPTSTSGADITLPSTCRRVAIWAAVRNNSAVATFALRAWATGASLVNVSGPLVTIDTETTNPRLVFLGVLAFAEKPVLFGLQVQASTAGGPPTLDVDYLAVLDVSDERSGAIMTPKANLLPTVMTYDPRPLSAATGTVTGESTNAPISYRGDAFLVTAGPGLAVAFLGTAADKWCWTQNVITPAAGTYTLTGTRWKARLTPE